MNTSSPSATSGAEKDTALHDSGCVLLQPGKIGRSKQRASDAQYERARLFTFVACGDPFLVGLERGTSALAMPEVVPLQHVEKVVGVLADVDGPEPDRAGVAPLSDRNRMLAKTVHECRKLAGHCMVNAKLIDHGCPLLG